MGSAAGMAVSATGSTAIRSLLLLSPEFHLLFLGAFYTPLPHFDIVLDFSLGKLSVLAEDYIEAHAEHTQCNKYDGCNEYFHQLMKLELIGS